MEIYENVTKRKNHLYHFFLNRKVPYFFGKFFNGRGIKEAWSMEVSGYAVMTNKPAREDRDPSKWEEESRLTDSFPSPDSRPVSADSISTRRICE